MMWSVDYKSPDVSLHKTLQFRSLTVDCSIATVSMVTMLCSMWSCSFKCTAVCRTVVIQQAVVGGGLGVLCG